MGYIGKDGAYYNDYNSLRKADAQWEQRDKQNKLLEEQNRLAQDQFQMQQQAIQQQQELERQRMIAENNAEIERLTNMLREHCRAIGIDYDYLMNFYNKLYKDKEKNSSIIELENKITRLKDLRSLIYLKEELKPYNKLTWIYALLIGAGLPILFPLIITGFVTENYLLGIISTVLLVVVFAVIKKITPNKEVRIKNNGMVRRKNELRMKYKPRRLATKEEYDKKIDEIQKQIALQTKQANSSSRKIQSDFDEFRKNHYNKELELLFKDLEIGFNKIAPSEAKGEGTIAEYDEYIKDKILEN